MEMEVEDQCQAFPVAEATAVEPVGRLQAEVVAAVIAVEAVTLHIVEAVVEAIVVALRMGAIRIHRVPHTAEAPVVHILMEPLAAVPIEAQIMVPMAEKATVRLRRDRIHMVATDEPHQRPDDVFRDKITRFMSQIIISWVQGNMFITVNTSRSIFIPIMQRSKYGTIQAFFVFGSR